MIGTLIGILLTLVIVGVIWWGVQQILAVLPIAEPFATIVRVVIVLISLLIVIWVISGLLGVAGVPVFRW